MTRTKPESWKSKLSNTIIVVTNNRQIIAQYVTHENHQFICPDDILKLKGVHHIWNAVAKYIIKAQRYNS